jgi:hypothetical protein
VLPAAVQTGLIQPASGNRAHSRDEHRDNSHQRSLQSLSFVLRHPKRMRRQAADVDADKLLVSSPARRCRRVLEEEANHFATGIRPAWIRVGSLGVPAGPRVPSPMKDPMLQRG